MDFNDGSLCDLNNDGFIDVFTGSTLWLNDGNDNNWIKFNVEGLISNASGIGTRIEIFGDFGIQVREVRAGQGYAPMSSLTQFFGLGTYDEIETVVVTWPSGTVTTINNPEINTTIDVIEADCLFDTDPITASGPLELCPGETVTLTAPAGYEYTWNQGQGNSQTITVSEAGNYQVILGEIGGECLSISNSLLVTIDNLEAPTISFDGNNVSCASDPITLEASEGLSYQWSTNENTQSITVNESGVYTVSVEGACGAVTSEELELEFYQVADPVTNVNVEVSDAGDLTLEATGDNITWFSDNAGTDVVGTGNTLDINVTDEATYYVQNSLDFPGALQEGGKPSFAGGGGLPSSGGGSTFDVWEEFTLLTVLVNATQPGMRTVNLVNGNGAVLESITQFMDGEMILELNWTIPVGEEYQILCEENNLFRNNSGVSYPYPIGDVGSIYTSTFGGQYYYYFYDWQIQKQSFFCLSDLIEINVSVVGLDELSQVSGLEVFPNPSSDFINVGLNLKEDLNLQIELINSVGQKVISKNLGDRQAGEFLEQIDVRGFAPGTYELVLSNEKGQQVISVVIE